MEELETVVEERDEFDGSYNRLKWIDKICHYKPLEDGPCNNIIECINCNTVVSEDLINIKFCDRGMICGTGFESGGVASDKYCDYSITNPLTREITNLKMIRKHALLFENYKKTSLTSQKQT